MFSMLFPSIKASLSLRRPYDIGWCDGLENWFDDWRAQLLATPLTTQI
jgi:hypothetical protein